MNKLEVVILLFMMLAFTGIMYLHIFLDDIAFMCDDLC